MINQKKIAGEKACEWIKDGMVVGLGTGSTVYYTIEKLGEMVQKGLNITGVATSIETEQQARTLGIPLKSLNDVTKIDVTIDGADEINQAFQGIKGAEEHFYEKRWSLKLVQRIFGLLGKRSL